MNRPRRPQLPKDTPIREGTLFPDANQLPQPSALELAFYQGLKAEHGAYAFCIDRQSDEQTLKRKSHTGQIQRVEMILTFARVAECWAAPPTPIAKRKDGQLAYRFDRRTWFLDGEWKNASGLTAQKAARPEWWRAYDLARALALRGCAPGCFIVGEGTRLFRDELWIYTFCQSLWDAGIRVFAGGFGEINRMTISGFTAYVSALSFWLPGKLAGARKARRENGEVFNRKRPHYGLLVDPKEPSKVYAHPDQWPVLSALAHQLADAPDCGSLITACAWLEEAHGLKRSIGWLHNLLFKRQILDGVYETDRTWGEVRKIEQAPWRDLDIRPSGDRRYLRHEKEPLLIPIDFQKYDQQPIPPAVLERARRRVRGRRRNDRTPIPGLWLAGRFTRCAVCGHHIQELRRCRPTERYALICMCATTLRMRLNIPQRQARLLPECQHLRYASMPESLSAKVWRLLVEGVEGDPPPTPTSLDEEAVEERQLKAAIATADRELTALVDAMTQPGLTERMRAKFLARQAELSSELDAREAQLETLSTRMIQRRRENEAVQEFRTVLRRNNRTLSDEQKRELIDQVVDTIQVHLEEGWFEVRLNTSWPPLQGLRGHLHPADETSSPSCCAESFSSSSCCT